MSQSSGLLYFKEADGKGGNMSSIQNFQSLLTQPKSRADDVKSLLLSATSSHSTAELLLTPLPPLVTQLLPSTGASLHGEQLADLPPIYERIAKS